MLATAGQWHWAQIGPYQTYNTRTVLIQTANGSPGSVWNMDLAPDQLSTFNTVEVLYVSGSFLFFKDNQYETTRTLSWVPINGEFYSEISSWNTQLMGARNSTVLFYHNQLYYSGGWHNLSATVTSPDTTYFGKNGNAYTFTTWDNTCAN